MSEIEAGIFSCIPFRIKLRPLIKDIPFFSNLVVSFVDPPEINFDLGGVANLLDFPGLVEVAKSAAMESLSTMVVLPCGIVVPMVEQDSDVEQVDGIINIMHSVHSRPIFDNQFQDTNAQFSDLELLKIVVVRAKELLAMDTNLFSEDSSDPYVILRFDDLELTSKIIKKTQNPTWNLECQLAVSQDTLDTGSLELEVWDKDHVPPDDFLGRIRVPLTKLGHEKSSESW